MVLAAAQTITHHTAATAAAAVHLHYEGEIAQTPLASFGDDDLLDGIVVIAPQQGVVEIFPADSQALAGLSTVSDVAVGAGWDVALVVPAHRMGEAHSSLRGQPVRLQAWWADGGEIRFGGPELA